MNVSCRIKTRLRHCEERGDEAIHAAACGADCFAFAPRNDGVDGPTLTASSAKTWSLERHKRGDHP